MDGAEIGISCSQQAIDGHPQKDRISRYVMGRNEPRVLQSVLGLEHPQSHRSNRHSRLHQSLHVRSQFWGHFGFLGGGVFLPEAFHLAEMFADGVSIAGFPLEIHER